MLITMSYWVMKQEHNFIPTDKKSLGLSEKLLCDKPVQSMANTTLKLFIILFLKIFTSQRKNV